MDEHRKHAILFAAALLCARKLLPLMEKGCAGPEPGVSDGTLPVARGRASASSPRNHRQALARGDGQRATAVKKWRGVVFYSLKRNSTEPCWTKELKPPWVGPRSSFLTCRRMSAMNCWEMALAPVELLPTT
jgi:hypothetical protein